MGLKLYKVGPWDECQARLNHIAEAIKPEFEAQLSADGDFINAKIHEHVNAQDLGWAPLADSTVRLKGGNTTIMVETGTLLGSIKVKRVHLNDITFFIGVEEGTGHPSGYEGTQIMMWFEYGTDKQPPRPLFRPVWEEVEPIVKEHIRGLVAGLVGGTR